MSNTNTEPFYDPRTTNCPLGEIQKSVLFLMPTEVGQVYRISSKVFPNYFQVLTSQILTVLSRAVEIIRFSSAVNLAHVIVLW